MKKIIQSKCDFCRLFHTERSWHAYSPLILKLQVTFTKRLSFKTTFKEHSIIMYLNHVRRDKYPKPVSDLDIFFKKDYVLCTAKHCSLRSRKPNLYGDMKIGYSKITAAMEKLLYFWVDISDKRATNSTGIKRANWINCLLNILKVLLNLHDFPLLNINCTEPYLGPLYRSDIIVQILNCKIPDRSLLNGAVYKRFQRFHAGEDVRPVTSCKFLLWFMGP